ncbi:MAG TPA: phosphoenolpyruvate carboxylase, partial [Polyangiaceae bacterium LLY-WYZ-15_(1-7)]|nr:phosphoenolpyruvate carboxylase [Polyangiaceae bacterium LLY-WYZ-15_(1-7)]
LLERRDRAHLTPAQQSDATRALRARVEALWEHAAERPERPDVLEEVKAGLWYLRNVLLDAVPRLQRQLVRALEASYGPVDPLELPVPVWFGSWMGSDRDGNPFVNDGVTERTLELQRWICLDRYLADLDDLVDPLAAAAHRLPPHAGLDAALERAAAAVPEVAHVAARRNPHEPLRRLLTFMRERLERTKRFSAGAYARPEDFLRDLKVLRDVLRAARATALPDDALLDLIQRVRAFGFTLANLDVREDSRMHRRVLAELLGEPAYLEMGPEQRIEALQKLRLPPRDAELSDEAARLLGLFDTLGRLQARFGREAIGTYIISMSHSPADVLEVMKLAELHGLADHLDIVPLFETRAALRESADVLRGLFAHPAYREHLRRRGDTQELILGYSDSMKEAGILASRVGVLETQRVAARVCAEHGVALRVFHGRGGSVSRGGGPTYRAIRALPPEVFGGDTKLTEQGEVRAFHFSGADLAVRYLEQTVGAAVGARFEARYAPRREMEGEGEALEALAQASHDAYRELVEDPGLVPYFETATPFHTIAQLNIASRPAKRRGGELSLSDLRAIPWVFSWSQCRTVITGWYGVGTGLSAMLENGGEAQLHRLYDRSPFFRDLLDNVEMTLAKVDLAIGRRYAELCPDEDVRERVFGRICHEHDATRAAVLRVSGAPMLLHDDPVVRGSIELRNPYVDPLSYLQVEALRRARSGDEPEAWDAVARVAVQGIAAGLRNTG